VTRTRGRTAGGEGAARRPRATWAVRGALVVTLALVVLAFSPGSAPAGTYTVESCSTGSAPFNRGLYCTWGDTCGLAGEAMSATITNRPAGAPL